jgi:peptide/nickel transport system substrate-binding protein
VNRNLALVLAALALGACTKAADTTAGGATSAPGAQHNRFTIPHVLRIGDFQDITTLNPHIGTATSLGNLSQLTMAYLVRYGPDNRPIPELVTEVPTQANGGVSKDGLTITWHIRKGVKWSDGQPFDADDVVWSTNAVNNTANNEVGRDGWELITKIDEPDKYTVVYHLKSTYSGYLPSFFGTAGANPCILPKHLLAKLPNFNNADYNSKPVGIGPFRYVKWVRGDHVELEANPYYWRGQPKIKKILYQFVPDRNTLLNQLTTGEIDMWPYVGSGYYQRVAAIPTANVYKQPGYYFAHIDFNTTRPIFKDPAVRMAFEYATDREAIRLKVNHGTGTLSESQLSVVSPMYTPRLLRPFDLSKANAILDQAGWVKGPDGIRAKNGTKLSFTVAIGSGAPDTDQLVELVRQTWQQVGARFELRRYAPALFFAAYSQGGILYGGKWDVTTFAWGMTPDADYTVQNNCDGFPPKGQNVTRHCDPVIQGLLQQSKAAYDEGPRKDVIAKLDARLDEIVPYFVLYVRDDIHGYNKDLRNWKPNAATAFDDMLNVDI